MAQELLLFRHGRTVGEPDVCKGNTMDAPLSSEGESQTRENMRVVTDIARERSLSLFTSPLQRCHTAIEHVDDTAEAHVLQHLRDIDIGALEGLTYAEVDEQFPGLLTQLRSNARAVRRLPHARETIEAFRMRAEAVLQEILACRSEVIAVVTHGSMLAELRAALHGDERMPIRYLQDPYGGATIVRMDDGQSRILAQGQTLYHTTDVLCDLYPGIFSPSPALQA